MRGKTTVLYGCSLLTLCPEPPRKECRLKWDNVCAAPGTQWTSTPVNRAVSPCIRIWIKDHMCWMHLRYKDGIGVRLWVVGSMGRGLFFILCFLYSFLLSFNSWLVFSPNSSLSASAPLSPRCPLPQALAGRASSCRTVGWTCHVPSPPMLGTILIWATLQDPGLWCQINLGSHSSSSTYYVASGWWCSLSELQLLHL